MGVALTEDYHNLGECIEYIMYLDSYIMYLDSF